ALATRTRTRHADRLLLNVLTLRIIRTGDELAKASETLHELRAVNRTDFVKRDWRRRGHTGLSDLADVAAFGITRAAEERTKTSTLQLHRLAAQFANFRFGFLTVGGCFCRRAGAV